MSSDLRAKPAWSDAMATFTSRESTETDQPAACLSPGASCLLFTRRLEGRLSFLLPGALRGASGPPLGDTQRARKVGMDGGLGVAGREQGQQVVRLARPR